MREDSTMDKPQDNSKLPPEVHLIDALTVGMSNAIELSEAAGQSQMVESEVIPTDGADALTELGFKLGEVIQDDPIFRACELPEGWRREGSDHSMWSYIVDENGFRRVAVFYKAAFYDRSAHCRVESNPETKAQADTYQDFSEWCPWPQWSDGGDRSDGENLVRRSEELVLDANGKPAFNHGEGDWWKTGRIRERVIAPDGSLVSESDTPANK